MNYRAWIACAAFAVSGYASAAPLLAEGFDDTATLAGSGWVLTNNSSPLGEIGWFQGNSGILPAQSGPATSYIGANYLSAGVGGAVSNWLISPELNFSGLATLSFYLRLYSSVDFYDTVQIYQSSSGESTDVGSSTTSTGDFVLLDTFTSTNDTGWVNHLITLGWVGSFNGRFAFRYVVGNTDIAGDYIGIDTVSVTAADVGNAVPEPTSLALIGLGLAGIAAVRRRKQVQA